MKGCAIPHGDDRHIQNVLIITQMSNCDPSILNSLLAVMLTGIQPMLSSSRKKRRVKPQGHCCLDDLRSFSSVYSGTQKA